MQQSEKIKQVKQQAKRMSERMNKMGFAVSPRQALELVAAERGFETWHAYEAELRKPEPKTPKWTKKQGPMTQTQYLQRRQSGTNPCPVCGSSEIEGDSIEIDGKFAFQECGCSDCESTWLDRYVAEAYILTQIGLGADAAPGTTLKAYTIAAYEDGNFLAKGTAFGNDEDEAREAFVQVRVGARDNSANFTIEFLGEVLATPEGLVEWWKTNDLGEDDLDELVYETVQQRGLPELNTLDSEEDQESHIEDRESQASRINNEGIEAQLRYLLSVCELDILLTKLANEIGLEGTPPQA
jgi:hypothetical protein